MNMLPTQADKEKFFSYPETEQKSITEQWDVMEEIYAAVNKEKGAVSVRAACREVANRFPNKAGFSFARLQHLYPEWEESGCSWKTLVNYSKYPEETEKVIFSRKFLDFVGGLILENQRKDRPAWRKLIRRWQAWRSGNQSMAIPGYDECPPPGRNGRWPAGWDYKNLRNKVALTRAEKALARVGTAAAMKLLPPVPQTRVGLRPLEYVFFDDVWVDRKVVVSGYGACRLLQLGCLDYASGVYLKFGQRPEVPTDKGTHERLKERDMKWLVATFLEEWGYPADYDMTLICERGTATLRRAEARALYDLSNGRIKVVYTSMQGELIQAWDERSTGNSRGKAALESWHNLFHNENANLIGQVGKDRDHSPAALLGMEKEAQALETAKLFLTDPQRSRIAIPFPDVRQAYFETLDVVKIINNRKDHACEGFDRLPIWRINAPGVMTDWKSDSEYLKDNLPVVPAELVKYVEWNSRVETPLERLFKLSRDVKWNKIPFGILPRFYEDSHVLQKIKDYGFSFKRDGKVYSYYPPSPEQALPEGKEFLGYYRPHDMGTLHLTEQTPEGPRYVATWKLQTRANRHDGDAIAASIKFQQSMLNQAMGNVRKMRKDFIQEQEARIRQNMEVLKEAQLIPSGTEGTPLAKIAQRITTPAAQALAQVAAAQDETIAHAAAVAQVDTVAEQLKTHLPDEGEDTVDHNDW